jgi:hypothetical protein
MTSASSVTSPGFFHDLFTPLPEEPSSTENRDFFDHVSDYAKTTDGAWDLFRVIEYATEWIQKIPSLTSQGSSALLGRISNVIGTMGMGLSIPAIATDCNHLRSSLARLFTVQDLPYSDPLRSQKITQAVKKGFLDLLGFANDMSQAALFMDRVKVLVLEASQLKVADGIYSGTSIAMDSVDLVSEYFKLQRYHSQEAQPRNPIESAKLEQKKTLAWMTIVKDIFSIASSGLAMIAMIFGAAALGVSTANIAFAGLTLSTVWLVTKMTSHFYNKLVVEAPIRV